MPCGISRGHTAILASCGTRRDRAERMKLSEAHQRGGQGTILADRMLHEVAYKLGRAPKYGA